MLPHEREGVQEHALAADEIAESPQERDKLHLASHFVAGARDHRFANKELALDTGKHKDQRLVE